MNFIMNLNITSKKRILFGLLLILCVVYIIYYEYRRATVLVESIKWKKLGKSISKGVSSAAGAVSSGVQSGAAVVGGGIQTGIGAAGSGIQTGIGAAGSGIQTGIGAAGSGIQTGISQLQNTFDRLKSLGIENIIKKIKGTFGESLFSFQQIGDEFSNELSNYVSRIQNISSL